MSSYFVLFQLPPFNNFCWQLGKVMAVNYFGSGVTGLSVHAFTHTPPSSWLLNGKEKRTLHPRRFFFLSPWVAEHPCTEISHPSSCLSIHEQKWSCFSSLRTSIVCSFLSGSDFFPRTGILLFLAHIVSWELCVFTHEFPEKNHSHPQLYVLLTDRYGCVISVILMLRLELLFFPHVYCLVGTV